MHAALTALTTGSQLAAGMPLRRLLAAARGAPYGGLAVLMCPAAVVAAPARAMCARLPGRLGFAGLGVIIAAFPKNKSGCLGGAKSPVPGAGWSAADDDVLVKKSTGAGVNVMADASQLPLAPVLARCVAAVIDGLLLLSLSALALLTGLRGGRVQFDGVDWESFYYIWSHLPTLCTVSVRRPQTPSAAPGRGSAATVQQWPLFCDISPTAILLHLYFDVAWNGQTPGKYLLGLRTERLDGLPMDIASASVGLLGRFSNLFFALDYWWCLTSPGLHQQLTGVGEGAHRERHGQPPQCLHQCLHNRVNGTKVVCAIEERPTAWPWSALTQLVAMPARGS